MSFIGSSFNVLPFLENDMHWVYTYYITKKVDPQELNPAEWNHSPEDILEEWKKIDQSFSFY